MAKIREEVASLDNDIPTLWVQSYEEGLARVGLMLGFFLARSMSALLYGVAPWDRTVFLITAVGLSIAGILACVVPATRAVRADPMDVLRRE